LQAFTEGLIEGHIATDIIITISGWIITISGRAGPLPPAAGRGAYVIDPKEWQHSLLSIAAREVEFAGTTLNLVRSIGDQGQGDGSEMSGRTISDEFDGLDATEKAGIGATLNRCRALAAKLSANSVTRGPSSRCPRTEKPTVGRERICSHGEEFAGVGPSVI
jgi:hypothetical protein